MKTYRVALFITALLIAPSSMLAQQRVNAIRIPPLAATAPQSAASRIPQIAGKWDILSTDPGGDQYNTFGGTYFGPIEFTVDFTETGTTLTEVAGHTFTSSACSADGTATITGNIDPDGNSRNAVVSFMATVDNGYQYTFAGRYNKNEPNQISGIWFTQGGACGLQVGQFTAYQYNQLTNYSYVGEFTSDVNGTRVDGVTVSIKEANDFSVSGTVSGPANSCFVGLTIDATRSMVTGGISQFTATNSQGALVAFVGSNTNSLFQQLPNDQPNETSLYITYAVIQGGGYCRAGDSGHDDVFHLKMSAPVRHPDPTHRGR
jgi:hypothetical protein